MRRAKPFHETGYTEEQEEAIIEILKPYLKPDANPKAIRFEIAPVGDLCEGAIVPGAVAYRPTVKKQLNAVITTFTDAKEILEALGIRYQWHIDDQICFGHRLDMLETLDMFLNATRRAATKPNPHVHIQETGTPRDHAMRLAVTSLLEIFERATGIQPTIYSNQHAADGIHGTCYKFLVACLEPMRLVAPKTLRSSILREYRQWKRVLRASDLDQEKGTIVTIQSVEYRKRKSKGGWALRFDELEGCLPLDQSTIGAICGLYRDDFDDWIGKKITLCPDRAGIRIEGPTLKKSTKYPPAA